MSKQKERKSTWPSLEERLERCEPGQLVRVVNAPPGVIYCSPRGEWDLWVDELRSRHGGSTAVVLESPRSTYGAVSSGRPSLPRSTQQLSRDAHYNPKRAVKVLMDDGWIGNVWLGALREVS